MIQEQYPDDRGDYRETEPAGGPKTYEPRDTREPRHLREGYEPRATRQQRAEPYESRETMADQPTEVQTVFSTSGINIIAGLWLILAPFALGYSNVEAAVWNSIILGVAVAVMAIVRVIQPLESEGVSWVNFVLGIWLLVSPFVLGLANIEALVWNNIVVGVVILALAAASAMATRHYHDPGARGHSGKRHSSRIR